MTDPGAALHRPMGAPHVQGYRMDVLESCSFWPPWAALIAHSRSWVAPSPKELDGNWKVRPQLGTLSSQSVI